MIGSGIDVSANNAVNATVVDNVEKGTVKITMPASGQGTDSVTLSGVRLDVREAEAPSRPCFRVTPMPSSPEPPTSSPGIVDALEVASTSKSALLTRGDTGMATVTIKEAFA